MNIHNEHLYKLFLSNPHISIDSRTITKNALFFALKGEQVDGNAFANQAIINGATYAIIDNPKYKKGDRFILVDDVLSSLQELATTHREKLKKTIIIAITGTNGKTTTKELINKALSSQYKTVATTGNLNNHIGVPLTVLSITTKTEIAIIEMGANHNGEIATLCKIAQPHYGIITNIGKAHIEGFGSLEGIIKAKNELYQYIHSAKGKVFVNADNTLLKHLSSTIEQITYGLNKQSDCVGEILSCNPFLKISWHCKNKKENSIQSQLVGTYNFENILAAVCIANHFNIPEKEICKSIESYTPSNNRSQFLQTEHNKIILDAYNANPTSMQASIQNFATLKAKNKTMIIGDMFELGEEATQEHINVIEFVKKQKFDTSIFIGSIFSSLLRKEKFHSFANVNEAIAFFKKHPINNSLILIKGSRKNQLEKLTDLL